MWIAYFYLISYYKIYFWKLDVFAFMLVQEISSCRKNQVLLVGQSLLRLKDFECHIHPGARVVGVKLMTRQPKKTRRCLESYQVLRNQRLSEIIRMYFYIEIFMWTKYLCICITITVRSIVDACRPPPLCDLSIWWFWKACYIKLSGHIIDSGSRTGQILHNHSKPRLLLHYIEFTWLLFKNSIC